MRVSAETHCENFHELFGGKVTDATVVIWGSPHRLRVVAALAAQRNYVSQLARELDISRALLQVHLRKLQAAGLVSADIEVSQDGKAMKFYQVTPFALQLTPQTIMVAVRTLRADNHRDAEVRL